MFDLFLNAKYIFMYELELLDLKSEGDLHRVCKQTKSAVCLHWKMLFQEKCSANQMWFK